MKTLLCTWVGYCALLLPWVAAAKPANVSGKLQVIFSDDLKNRKSETSYQVFDSRSGKTYRLQFDKNPKALPKAGSLITAQGDLSGSTISLEESAIAVSAASDVGAPTGEQRTLVMLVNYQDMTNECTKASITEQVFTGPLNISSPSPGQQYAQGSINALYREMSGGKVFFTGEVIGPLTIPYSAYTVAENCDLTGWSRAADAAATSMGYNLSQYDRLVYLLPETSYCPLAGKADLGITPSRAWVALCSGAWMRNVQSSLAHELGHNLGMSHASLPGGNEYGDTDDIMGAGGAGLSHVNAPHKEEMGWIPSSEFQVVTGPGIFTIGAMEYATGVSAFSRGIKIPKPFTDEYYFLSMRANIGFDVNLNLSGYPDVLRVHTRKSSGPVTNTQDRNTIRHAALLDSQSYSDPVTGVSVTLLSHTADTATVRVEAPPLVPCTRNAPEISLSPSTQSGSVGSTLSYVVTVKNTDSGMCPLAANVFSLSASYPTSSWYYGGSLSVSSLSLTQGATGSAILNLRSPYGTPAGSYPFSIQANDPVYPEHSGSGAGTYEIVSAPAPSPSPSPTSTIDSTAPTIPSGLSATYVSGSQKLKRAAQVSLSWSSSADKVGVKGYRVFKNGSLLGSTLVSVSSRGTTFSDTAIQSGASYSYSVQAFDAAGNSSALSGGVSITIPVSTKGRK